MFAIPYRDGRQINPWLSSVEELYYYRIFKETFPEPAFDRLVGRWDPFRPAFFRDIEKAI